MFYLVDSNDQLVREHENKMALRRIRRKSPLKDSLRITEGETFKQSLKHAKDLSKAVAKVKTPKVEKPVKEKKAKAPKKVTKVKKEKKAKKA